MQKTGHKTIVTIMHDLQRPPKIIPAQATLRPLHPSQMPSQTYLKRQAVLQTLRAKVPHRLLIPPQTIITKQKSIILNQHGLIIRTVGTGGFRSIGWEGLG